MLSIVVKLLLDDPTQNNPNLARYFASKEYDGIAKDPHLEVIYEDSAPVALFSHSPSYPVANDTVTFNASCNIRRNNEPNQAQKKIGNSFFSYSV